MLDFRVTDRSGEPLFRIVDFANGQVEVPINDARMAKVDISMYSEVARYVFPLASMLKVIWDNHLIFWGPITQPNYSFQSGTITINAHDPSWWWKFHHHRFGDAALSPYPINGKGARTLAKSAEISHDLHAAGVQKPGIYIAGYDDTDIEDTQPSDLTDTALNPDPNGVVWVKGAERGQPVFETLQKLSETISGCDFELQPVDADHLTDQFTAWAHNTFCQLNTFSKQGNDLRGSDAEPAFHYGWGVDNLAEMTYDPDASKVVNRAITTDQSGEKDGAESKARAIIYDLASWEAYGVMEKWQTGSINDTPAMLEARSRVQVQAFRVPPNDFSVTPKPNWENAPLWIRDFNLGDIITVTGKKGQVIVSVDGRIVKVTLNQQDQANNSVTTIECIPDVSGTPAVGEGGAMDPAPAVDEA